jgi:hypothetical protein
MKLVSSVMLDESVLRRSSVANIITSILVYFIGFVLPQKENVLIYDFVFGICFTYIIDILFVQKNFRIKEGFNDIPYDDFMFRVKYMFNPRIFYKFLVVISIGSIINRSVYIFITNMLEKYNLFQDEKTLRYRNFAINVVINFFITLMLLNYIKFKWAYINCEDVYLTMIIISLFSLSILISVS